MIVKTRSVRRVSPKGEIKNRNIVELVLKLNTEFGPNKSRNQIAREYTGEPKGNDPQARNLLSLIRRLVREADLPYALRVIKPTDGIATYAVDPNRLTLLLSEDGRIIDAAWD